MVNSRSEVMRTPTAPAKPQNASREFPPLAVCHSAADGVDNGVDVHSADEITFASSAEAEIVQDAGGPPNGAEAVGSHAGSSMLYAGFTDPNLLAWVGQLAGSSHVALPAR
eukprot:scaffold2141_cov282-Pinguiococcus_pyrenoidosus.AAC.5